MAASFTMAGGAAAQTSPSQPPTQTLKATPEQIAAARLEGDAVLQGAQAQDLFDNETGLYGTAAIILRHRASGFVCLLDPGSPINNVLVYPNPHRGDDVGCNTGNRITGSRTTNFTRDGHTDEQTIAGAGVAIQRRFPDAQPAPAPTHLRPLATMFPNVPAPKSVRFVRPGAFEEDVSAHVDGWLVEDRITANPSLAQSNVLDMHWYVTVSERQRHQQTPSSTNPTPAQASQTKANAPATPEEIALARTQGDRILFGNQTQALFDNITDSKVIALRHKASGLVCRFDLGGANAVQIGPGAGTSNRADAVNCMSSLQAFGSVLTLSANPDHRTADQALADTVAIMRTLFPDLRPFAGKSVTMTNKAAPPHRSVNMLTGPASTPTYYYVSAAAVGDWIVVEQVHGPTAPEMAGSLLGEIQINAAIGDLAKTKPASGI